MLKNHALDKMRSGGIALVASVRYSRLGDAARLLHHADYDVLVIDCEHQTIPADACTEMIAAALDVGITALVRVPGHEPGPITQALAGGALGVVVPHVSTAEEARAISAVTQFAPAGYRSVPPMFPHFGWQGMPQGDAIRLLSGVTMNVAIIETAQGVENLDAIAAVPGMDVLFLGCSDLAQSMGIAGQKDHPALLQAAERVVAVSRTHGRIPGIGGITEDHQFERAIAQGMRYLSVGTDSGFLMEGAKRRSAAVRKFGQSARTDKA